MGRIMPEGQDSGDPFPPGGTGEFAPKGQTRAVALMGRAMWSPEGATLGRGDPFLSERF